MAKTLEQVVQEQLGALMLQNAKLAAELELAREALAAAEAHALPKKKG